jgi:Cytidylyltransferase-like
MLEVFYHQEARWVLQDPNGQLLLNAPPPHVLFPGSFNPLHVGHTRLAELVVDRLGNAVTFELSIRNVDKPELPADEVLWRLEQFRGRAPVIVTRAATFVEKAVHFPGSVFVVGADTAARITHPRYYGNDPAKVAAALEAIRAAGCRFFVGGRVDADGLFVEVGQVPVPEGYRDLFSGPGEREFRVDISSTELRREGNGWVVP